LLTTLSRTHLEFGVRVERVQFCRTVGNDIERGQCLQLQVYFSRSSLSLYTGRNSKDQSAGFYRHSILMPFSPLIKLDQICQREAVGGICRSKDGGGGLYLHGSCGTNIDSRLSLKSGTPSLVRTLNSVRNQSSLGPRFCDIALKRPCTISRRS
jgi:hypothetical protein